MTLSVVPRALVWADDLFPEERTVAPPSVADWATRDPSVGQTTDPLSSAHEESFIAATDRAARKRLGQFFTPAPLAKLMASWLREIAPARVLDPAVGPGMLLAAMTEADGQAHLTGIDIDGTALRIARQRIGSDHDLVECDFLRFDPGTPFDAVIANPPYIRHHSMEVDGATLDAIARRARVKVGGLTNIYLYFVLKSIDLLREGGRGAFLIPAEWSNANYGHALKQFFSATGYLRHVVYFSHKGLQFEDNLSTACLLLVERRQGGAPVETAYVPGEAELTDIAALRGSAGVTALAFPMPVLARARKWDALLSRGTETSRSGAVRLGEIARTRRGIATGDNRFFLLSRSRADALGLPADALRPCIGKAGDVDAFLFTPEDFDALAASDRPAWLFDPPDDTHPAVTAYLDQGRRDGVADRYLTRTKALWYRAEQRAPAPIWVGVFGRTRLRFVRNRADVRNLTAFHGLYPLRTDALFLDALVACLNSDVVASAVARQQRVYGGGLLKIEPRDLLEIEVPDLRAVEATLLMELAAELAGMRRASAVTPTLNALVETAFAQAADRRHQSP